ncbi:MAG: SsrA-binding protein SmpB [Eggerthellaceae bacterium]|nr:SsrA-binding protein SmpB [Eggerthellaceae bacterium]
MAKKPKHHKNYLASNKRAFYDYEILETFEAGIELAGTEVKSLRENRCQLTDSFAYIRGGELWLNNMHIPHYSHGNIANRETKRKRKLLMHKNQIRYLGKKVNEKGIAIVPLKIYFKKNKYVKVEIGLVKGKKLHDKRESIKRKDQAREIAVELKWKNR